MKDWQLHKTPEERKLRLEHYSTRLASFPGSPLAKRRGRTWYRFACDIAVRRRHSNNYKSRDAIMQPRDWLAQTSMLVLLTQVSCDCIGETLARLRQQRWWRSTQYHVQLGKNCYKAMKKDFSWLALHSGVQNKITTTF